MNNGLSAVPISSPIYIYKGVNWILDKKGGERVFREFIKRILAENHIDVLELIKNKRSQILKKK